MKLGEALATRVELQNNIKRISDRIKINLTVQEGEKPAEDPAELLQLFERLQNELGTLTAKIKDFNERTVVDGSTLADMLVQQRHLMRMTTVYNALTATFSRSTVYTGSSWDKAQAGIVMKPMLAATELQERAAWFGAKLKQLDAKLQETSWKLTI